YTARGGEISLTAVTLECALQITVADNGIGITTEALPAVFELFMQDASALALSSGGLGIGLAVVRDLVEAHQGTVVASSLGRDHGSQFVVTLPMVAAPMTAGVV
ncbi:MAG TPA: ATP-binding protein, partial [Steroidobacteraceae bacterium]